MANCATFAHGFVNRLLLQIFLLLWMAFEAKVRAFDKEFLGICTGHLMTASAFSEDFMGY